MCGYPVFNKGPIKKKESIKIRNIFWIVSSPFSSKTINIHLYISYKALYAHSLRLVSAKWYIISLLTEKPFHLLRPESFSIQIMSNTFVKFSNFMSQTWSFWAPALFPGGRFLYAVIVPGKDFCPFESCPGRGVGGMVLDEIDSCIRVQSIPITVVLFSLDSQALRVMLCVRNKGKVHSNPDTIKNQWFEHRVILVLT